MDTLPCEVLWIIVRSSGLSMSDTARLAASGNVQLRTLHDDHVDHRLADYARESRPGTDVEWVRRHGIVHFARSMAWTGQLGNRYKTTRDLFTARLGWHLPLVERAVLSEEATAEFININQQHVRHASVDLEMGSRDLYDQVKAHARSDELVLVDWEGEPATLCVNGLPVMMPRLFPMAAWNHRGLLPYTDMRRMSNDTSHHRMNLTMITGWGVYDLQRHVFQRLEAAGFAKNRVWCWRSGAWNILQCADGSQLLTYRF